MKFPVKWINNAGFIPHLGLFVCNHSLLKLLISKIIDTVSEFAIFYLFAKLYKNFIHVELLFWPTEHIWLYKGITWNSYFCISTYKVTLVFPCPQFDWIGGEVNWRHFFFLKRFPCLWGERDWNLSHFHCCPT